jgi:hypothetical protein
VAYQRKTFSLDQALAPALEKLASMVAEAFAEVLLTRVEAELARRGAGRGGRPPGRRGAGRRGEPVRRRRVGDITRWVTDARARRVPRFVIEVTGLDTKTKLVAKYGRDAVFVKGRSLPKPVRAR